MVSRTKKGFTIVELLIVIVVIAILAAISIVAYNNVTQKARDDQRLADARNIVNAAASFNAESETGAWPSISDLQGYGTVKLSGTASSNITAETTGLAHDKYGYTKCDAGVKVTYYKEADAGARQTITAGTCS